MRLPRSVLKADGLTLSPFHLAKAVGGKFEQFSDDRAHVWVKVVLIVLAFLAAAVVAR